MVAMEVSLDVTMAVSVGEVAGMFVGGDV